MKENNTQFPEDFFWGASTASHQVEGRNINQWSVWELSVANEQAKTAKERLGWLQNWEEVKNDAQDPENYISGVGIEHYSRYKEDLEFAQKLGLNSFRFGIEWSRLEPEEGKWDDEAWEHYRHYILEIKKHGLEPFLNIWHWTLPIWFTEKGGFAKRENLQYFEKFIKKITEEIDCKSLKYIITLNEPNVYASFGYVTGVWPPNEKKFLTFVKVYWNLARAHRSAYRILKEVNPKLQIGIASQLANIQAKRPHNLIDQIATKWMRYYWNWWFHNRIKHQQDFIGFNYYFTDYYEGFKRHNPKTPVNDLGWYMEPEGIYLLLLRVWQHYKKPMFITENGLADSKDEHRRWWLQETMISMEKAISEGVDLKGYFHWSLLDNFEWAYGWWPKFGLIEVDRKTMKRKVRPSALWLQKELRKIRK